MVRGIRCIVCPLMLAPLVVLALATTAHAGPPPVLLGTADGFALLAGSTITNTGDSVINGDVGLHPGTAVTGFPPGIVNGALHITDAVAMQAKTDLTTAYLDAAGRPLSATAPPDIGGQTLVAGIYRTGSVPSLGLTGNLTLDAQGDPRAVFIFQVESTLVSATDSSVSLINGAQACNVYWQVGSSATLGTRTAFKGTILALTSVSVNDGVTVDGRLLARNGAVTLINDRISRSQCAPGISPGTGTGGGTPQFGLYRRGGIDTASGPDRKGPVVTITGVPARTARNFTVGVRVRDRAGIKTESVSVYLDGRLVKRTSRTRFKVKINVRGLRVGRHRLTVVARDRAGNRQTVTRRHFTRRAPKSPVPHFTG